MHAACTYGGINAWSTATAAAPVTSSFSAYRRRPVNVLTAAATAKVLFLAFVLIPGLNYSTTAFMHVGYCFPLGRAPGPKPLKAWVNVSFPNCGGTCLTSMVADDKTAVGALPYANICTKGNNCSTPSIINASAIRNISSTGAHRATTDSRPESSATSNRDNAVSTCSTAPSIASISLQARVVICSPLYKNMFSAAYQNVNSVVHENQMDMPGPSRGMTQNFKMRQHVILNYQFQKNREAFYKRNAMLPCLPVFPQAHDDGL